MNYAKQLICVGVICIIACIKRKSAAYGLLYRYEMQSTLINKVIQIRVHNYLLINYVSRVTLLILFNKQMK